MARSKGYIMIEVLNFAFQSFWHFLGVLMLLSLVVTFRPITITYTKES